VEQEKRRQNGEKKNYSGAVSKQAKRKTKRENGKQGRKKIGTVYTENTLRCVFLGVTTLLSNPNPRAKRASN